MNKQYVRYEVQERKYSSNIVIGIHRIWNTQKQKWEEEKDKIIAPLLSKVEGDKYSKIIVDFLNSQFEQNGMVK